MSEYTLIELKVLVQALMLKLAIHSQYQETQGERIVITTNLLEKFKAQLDSVQESK